MARTTLSRPSLFAAAAALLICALAAATPAAPDAQTTTTNARAPVAGTVLDCAGNPVDISGEIHILSHSTVSESGHVTVVSHINQRLQGVGADGTRHVMNQQLQETITFDGTDGAPSTQTFVIHSNLNNNDPAVPQLHIRALFHATFNANGELTGVQTELKEECQG